MLIGWEFSRPRNFYDTAITALRGCLFGCPQATTTTAGGRSFRLFAPVARLLPNVYIVSGDYHSPRIPDKKSGLLQKGRHEKSQRRRRVSPCYILAPFVAFAILPSHTPSENRAGHARRMVENVSNNSHFRLHFLHFLASCVVMVCRCDFPVFILFYIHRLILEYVFVWTIETWQR